MAVTPAHVLLRCNICRFHALYLRGRPLCWHLFPHLQYLISHSRFYTLLGILPKPWLRTHMHCHSSLFQLHPIFHHNSFKYINYVGIKPWKHHLVSGSPNLALYSSTFGPSFVIISPKYNTPLNFLPSFSIASIVACRFFPCSTCQFPLYISCWAKMFPYSGIKPWSLSKALLWSWEETMVFMVFPSVKASIDTSWPTKNSSITTLFPASPKTCPPWCFEPLVWPRQNSVQLLHLCPAPNHRLSQPPDISDPVNNLWHRRCFQKFHIWQWVYVFLHKIFRKSLAAFNHGRRLVWSKRSDSRFLKSINHTGCKRVVRRNHYHVNFLFLRKVYNSLYIHMPLSAHTLLLRKFLRCREHSTLSPPGTLTIFHTNACSRPPLPTTSTSFYSSLKLIINA